MDVYGGLGGAMRELITDHLMRELVVCWSRGRMRMGVDMAGWVAGL